MPRVMLAVWAAVLFAACMWVNTRHNNFPWYYHPDEPGKVEQVRDSDWNFHHPFLLLGTTKAVLGLTPAVESEQQIVVVGRTVSAAFVAGAAVLLSLLAYSWRGPAAAFLTGTLLATHHQLFELSHYFKEDPTLLFGLSATALALWHYWEKPTPARAAWLGVGCALAISGKYLGAISLLLAIPVLVKRPTARAWPLFAGALVAVFLAVNWPLFSSFETFRASFNREVGLVVGGQGGATRSVPHSEYWTIFRDNSTPAIWIVLVGFLVLRYRERRNLTLLDWILAGFPFAYALALSFSPKTNDRYFLPATAWICLLCAIGAADLASHIRKKGTWAIAAALLVAAQFPDWSTSNPGWLTYWRAFQVDDNAELIEMLRREIPADAVLLKDNRIALPDPKRKKHAARVGVVPQKVIAKRYAADAGPLEQLRQQGITHVVVSETDYGKFFRSSLRPQKGEEASFARRRDFYTALFNDAELIWERDRGTVIYLHPGIRVYRLP